MNYAHVQFLRTYSEIFKDGVDWIHLSENSLVAGFC